jgi:hypothetical protein
MHAAALPERHQPAPAITVDDQPAMPELLAGDVTVKSISGKHTCRAGSQTNSFTPAAWLPIVTNWLAHERAAEATNAQFYAVRRGGAIATDPYCYGSLGAVPPVESNSHQHDGTQRHRTALV